MILKSLSSLFGMANQRRYGPLQRKLRIEHYEDRRMLAGMTDVVFLVDESASNQTTDTQDWLASTIDELNAAFVADSVSELSPPGASLPLVASDMAAIGV